MAHTVLTLIRDHPRSDRIPAAYTLLADDYFERGRYDHAERIYDKVLSFDGAMQVAYAHYKIAWCRLSPKPDRPADPTGALHHFVRALDRAESGPTGDALRTLARRDLVIAYAEVGKPRLARAFFERVVRGRQARHHVHAMLESLASRYQALGRPSDAAVVVREH